MPSSGIAGSYGSFISIFFKESVPNFKVGFSPMLLSQWFSTVSMVIKMSDFKEKLELVPEITSTKAFIQSSYFHIKHNLG